MTVYKYPLKLADEQDLEIQQGAQFLTVAEQQGELVLYARVISDAPKVKRRIRVAGTGHPRVNGRYVGTAMMPSGLVWHVFCLGEVEEE